MLVLHILQVSVQYNNIMNEYIMILLTADSFTVFFTLVSTVERLIVSSILAVRGAWLFVQYVTNLVERL